MAQELTSAYAPRQAGGANDGCVSSVRPQELQNMRLVGDVGDGRTPHAAAFDAAGEQSTAVAESKDAEAKKYLNDMRGWIMTVATLFVNMSFQAMSQRPSWMPDPKDGLNFFLGKHRNSTDPVEMEALRVAGYVLLNTLTFSTSLVVVVILLLPNVSSPKVTLRTVRTMMMLLAIIVALNFAFMISKDIGVMKFVLTVMAIYAIATAIFTFSSSDVRRLVSKVTRRQSLPRSARNV